MKINMFRNITSIRFRRWSRAGYAVFRSLSCCVTIGCLAVGVSNKSLQKEVGTAISSLRTVGFAGNDSESTDECTEPELALLQLQEALFIEQTFEGAAACGSEIYLYNC